MMTLTDATLPEVTSREKWLRARKALLAKEKELTRHRDAVNAERRRLPMVRIDKRYVFDGPAGTSGLLELFEGRRQLIVYHFMFDPAWDEGCPSCSLLADNIGYLAHLHARRTSLAVVSRAPRARFAPYQRRMGWTFPWYSSFGSDFNYDFHVTHDEAVAPVEYNYLGKAELVRRGEPWFTEGESHGLSVFLRDGKRVFHTYSTYARGLDMLNVAYHYLDLVPKGRDEGERNGSTWVRRHDEYGGSRRSAGGH